MERFRVWLSGCLLGLSDAVVGEDPEDAEKNREFYRRMARRATVTSVGITVPAGFGPDIGVEIFLRADLADAMKAGQ